MLPMDNSLVIWCSFCNSAPSAGELKMEDDRGLEIDIPICAACTKRQLKKHPIPGTEDYLEIINQMAKYQEEQ